MFFVMIINVIFQTIIVIRSFPIITFQSVALASLNAEQIFDSFISEPTGEVKPSHTVVLIYGLQVSQFSDSHRPYLLVMKFYEVAECFSYELWSSGMQ